MWPGPAVDEKRGFGQTAVPIQEHSFHASKEIMMEQRKQLQAIVTGRVQGVSFRYYTRQQAEQLGLVGFVRNQRDGSVFVEAEGSETDLEKLLRFLHQGSPQARVTEVKTSWQPASEKYKRFQVRWF